MVNIKFTTIKSSLLLLGSVAAPFDISSRRLSLCELFSHGCTAIVMDSLSSGWSSSSLGKIYPGASTHPASSPLAVGSTMVAMRVVVMRES